MNYNSHYDIKGKHAFLSASKYSWIRYDEDKLVDTYRGFLATQRGTLLHDFACQSIKLGIRLPRNKKTLNLYVNDAIGFNLIPEQVLFYSKNCFGTADTISQLDDVYKTHVLRIHDLKTGVSPTSMDQLYVYASLFCLEYNMKPFDLKTELRIYQGDEIEVCNPEPEDLVLVMDKIVRFDKILTEIGLEEGAT